MSDRYVKALKWLSELESKLQSKNHTHLGAQFLELKNLLIAKFQSEEMTKEERTWFSAWILENANKEFLDIFLQEFHPKEKEKIVQNVPVQTTNIQKSSGSQDVPISDKPQIPADLSGNKKQESQDLQKNKMAPLVARLSKPGIADRIWEHFREELSVNWFLFLGAFMVFASGTWYVLSFWDQSSPIQKSLFSFLGLFSFYGMERGLVWMGLSRSPRLFAWLFSIFFPLVIFLHFHEFMPMLLFSVPAGIYVSSQLEKIYQLFSQNHWQFFLILIPLFSSSKHPSLFLLLFSLSSLIFIFKDLSLKKDSVLSLFVMESWVFLIAILVHFSVPLLALFAAMICCRFTVSQYNEADSMIFAAISTLLLFMTGEEGMLQWIGSLNFFLVLLWLNEQSFEKKRFFLSLFLGSCLILFVLPLLQDHGFVFSHSLWLVSHYLILLWFYFAFSKYGQKGISLVSFFPFVFFCILFKFQTIFLFLISLPCFLLAFYEQEERKKLGTFALFYLFSPLFFKGFSHFDLFLLHLIILYGLYFFSVSETKPVFFLTQISMVCATLVFSLNYGMQAELVPGSLFLFLLLSILHARMFVILPSRLFHFLLSQVLIFALCYSYVPQPSIIVWFLGFQIPFLAVFTSYLENPSRNYEIPWIGFWIFGWLLCFPLLTHSFLAPFFLLICAWMFHFSLLFWLLLYCFFASFLVFPNDFVAWEPLIRLHSPKLLSFSACFFLFALASHRFSLLNTQVYYPFFMERMTIFPAIPGSFSTILSLFMVFLWFFLPSGWPPVFFFVLIFILLYRFFSLKDFPLALVIQFCFVLGVNSHPYLFPSLDLLIFLDFLVVVFFYLAFARGWISELYWWMGTGILLLGSFKSFFVLKPAMIVFALVPLYFWFFHKNNRNLLEFSVFFLFVQAVFPGLHWPFIFLSSLLLTHALKEKALELERVFSYQILLPWIYASVIMMEKSMVFHGQFLQIYLGYGICFALFSFILAYKSSSEIHVWAGLFVAGLTPFLLKISHILPSGSYTSWILLGIALVFYYLPGHFTGRFFVFVRPMRISASFLPFISMIYEYTRGDNPWIYLFCGIVLEFLLDFKSFGLKRLISLICYNLFLFFFLSSDWIELLSGLWGVSILWYAYTLEKESGSASKELKFLGNILFYAGYLIQFVQEASLQSLLILWALCVFSGWVALMLKARTQLLSALLIFVFSVLWFVIKQIFMQVSVGIPLVAGLGALLIFAGILIEKNREGIKALWEKIEAQLSSWKD